MISNQPLKPQNLAKKLKTIRVNLGLSQNEMLEKLGYKDRLFRSNISQYERGDREPPLLVLLAYAQLGNTSIDNLVDDGIEL